MFFLARILAALTKTGILFLISKIWTKSQANSASEILIALSIGMIISSLDSGKIFYNNYFGRSNNIIFKEEYLLRVLFGLFLGGASLCFVLYQKNFTAYILIPCALILVAERTYDEVQRFLVSNKNYQKWSLIQICRSLLYLALTPLLFSEASIDKDLLLCTTLLIPTFLILLFFIKQNNKIIIHVINNLKNKFQEVFFQTVQNWKPCLSGLAGSSLALPKNILLIVFADNDINKLHLLFSICSLQSLYIFSFFLIRSRWKILQDFSGHSIINNRFYFNLVLSSFFTFICGLFIFSLNFISKSLFFYFPMIIANEFLQNLNSTRRDILFYRRKEANLLNIDISILCLFCIMVLAIPKSLTCGLILLILTEMFRNVLYKNKLSK